LANRFKIVKIRDVNDNICSVDKLITNSQTVELF